MTTGEQSLECWLASKFATGGAEDLLLYLRPCKMGNNPLHYYVIVVPLFLDAQFASTMKPCHEIASTKHTYVGDIPSRRPFDL